MTKDQAQAAINELESLIDEFGSSNEYALQRIKQNVSALKCGTGDFSGKLSDFEIWAKIGFSQRKFRGWGLDKVQHFARCDIHAARELAVDWPNCP